MKRFSPAAAALALAATATACGTPSNDLFVVERTGSLPSAKLTLLVRDDGTVRCDDGERKPIDSARLLDARTLADDLAEPAEAGLDLPPRERALLRYRFMVEEGTVRFSDVDAARRPELGRAQAFVRSVARDICGRPR
jgi:hypothetical protein